MATMPQLDDFGVELSSIERRRRLAETLGMQGMQPIEQQTAGGQVVPTHPLQALAKVFQGYIGGRGMAQADERQKALADALRGDRAQTMERASAALRGTPEQWMGSNAPGDAPVLTPAQPPNRESAYGILAGSRDPGLQQFGMQGLFKEQESPWSKIDPKDYTPESVRAFAATLAPGGRANPALLVPVRERKPVTTTGSDGRPVTAFVDAFNPPEAPLPQPVRREFVNAGDTVKPVDPYVQTEPIARRDTPEGFTRGPDGTLKIDPGFLAGKTQIAAAGRPQVQTTVNAPPASKVFENEGKMRDDYTTASKPFVGIRDAYNTVNAALTGDISAPATLAAATKFMKMLDPESVVRESELNMALRSTGLLDRFLNLHNIVLKGQVLTPTQVSEIKRISGALYETAQAQQSKTDEYYSGLARDYGLEPARIIRNQRAVTEGQNQPAPNPGRRSTDRNRRATDQPGAVIDFNNLPPGGR